MQRMISVVTKRRSVVGIVGLGIIAGLFHPKFYATVPGSVEDAETKLLSTHVVRHPYETFFVPLSSGTRIHTLKVLPTQPTKDKPPLVLVHGWGAGLALWGKNIDELSDHFSVYAIDLLGFGRSDRPSFPRASRSTPELAKAFWLDSFHEWKQEIFGNQKIYLLGHSLVSIHIPSWPNVYNC
jgi:pimeloyl-ACP methyl ester carboxylesterase